MGTSNVSKLVENNEIDEDWISDLIDTLDVAYDDIDSLETDLAALEATVDALVSEGDYSTYTLIKTIAGGATARGINHKSYFTPNEEKIVISSSLANVVILDISAGTLTEIISYVQSVLGFQHHNSSIYNKYVAYQEYSNPAKSYIVKDGVLLQTIEADDINNDHMEGLVISPSGKYLCIYWEDDSEVGNDEFKYLIYEGA